MKTFQTGDVVGDYRVIGIVGSGGMGAVYKIEHRLTRRIEALKLLPPGSAADPDQVQRFEREIQVQARLHHPNIVALYNAVREGDTIALVMEFVEGESLRRKLESGPLPVATAVDYTSQVLVALDCAHSAGVIHRDVAPSNIIVTPEGVAKLSDFGLARGTADVRLSSSGSPLGSPWYMSPEQVKGSGAVDARTDVYSMGAVFYEMLTGEKLFAAEGAFAVMRAQVEAPPPRPSSRNPKVPPALDEVVLKALAKLPAERFASAAEFRLALQYVIAGLPAATVPAAPPEIRAAAVLPPAEPPRRGFRPSRTAVLLALAPAALAAAGFCAVRLFPAAQLARTRAAATPAAAGLRDAPAPPPIPAAPAAPDASVAAPATAEAAAPEAPSKPTGSRSRGWPAARKPGAPQPNYAIRVTGSEQPPPMPVAPPRPAVARTPEASPPPVSRVDCPLPPPGQRPAAPGTAAAEEKPQNGGSRISRAFGKVNPFRKTAKYDTAAASQTPLKKD